MCTPARLLAIVLGLGLLPAAPAASEAPLPAIEMPDGARAELIGGDLLLDGKPCRMLRFEVAAPIEDVVRFYRARFSASRVVETRVKDQPVIATRRGDRFHTVQLRSVGAVVQGTVITTELRRAPLGSAAARDTEAMLPADTVIVSTLQSNDPGRRAVTLIGVNRNSVAANRAHLVAALRRRGFEPRNDDGNGPGHQGASLHLSSPSEDALLTVTDLGPYRTLLVQRTTDAKP